MNDDLVKRLARAWAGIEGKAAEFDACAANPVQDMRDGQFSRYMFQAEELMRRSGLAIDMHQMRLRADGAAQSLA
ncbi:hypothetical protein [Paracoccus laeviglucosivorans]|uniref:Uncharacterized protein n=1 Tax=Paracoccus laeviglucosivorans TaxID=1197861 RepID=A0A521EJX7_9RHOB|nr:hypothetical protein [Paracoccus laeviglucosivorans]SMO84214.1 hypothetical protein SAMN06265221_113110 [Paracoccus laeviglucosivorans]